MLFSVTALLMIGSVAMGATQAHKVTAPETFTCQAQGHTDAGASTSTVKIKIDRYIAPTDRKAIADSLTSGGYPKFLAALRAAPVLGQLEMGGQKFNIRWAHERPEGTGRAIVVLTDMPVYFLGGGRADAKPREGFELAVVQFTAHEVGFGVGTMAAAARVKSDGAGGVQIEDYAEEPIKLSYIKRDLR
jgi:hypothetical protein